MNAPEPVTGAAPAPRAIAPDLFDDGPDGPRLIGGRRKSDGAIVFPWPAGGERALYDAVRLKPSGALWSWTIQRFRPKSPPYAGPEDEAGFRPFAVGYVELPDEVIVEARLLPGDAALVIGMAMELTLMRFAIAADGADILTYAFRPAGSPGFKAGSPSDRADAARPPAPGETP